MNLRTEFNLNIEDDEIVRLFGYKNSEPGKEVLNSVREEIMKYKTYINPQIWASKINIKSIQNERVILDNDIVFKDKFIINKLKGCSYIIVLVSTIGIEIEKVIQSAFDDGNYLKGMIVDNIGTTALGNINKIFWSNLVDELKGTNIGITQRLSPGDLNWPLDGQNKIFDCFKGTTISVKLLKSSLMIPLKSTSAIFGFGEGIGITKQEHICMECNLQSCGYRMDKNIEVKIKTDNDIIVVKAFKGQNLLKILKENRIIIQDICNGKGTCGKCKVLITNGIRKTSKADIVHLSTQEIEKGIHLACSYKISDDITLTVISKEENMEVLTQGQELAVPINNIFKKKLLELKVPSILDQKDDLHRLKDALQL